MREQRCSTSTSSSQRSSAQTRVLLQRASWAARGLTLALLVSFSMLVGTSTFHRRGHIAGTDSVRRPNVTLSVPSEVLIGEATSPAQLGPAPDVTKSVPSEVLIGDDFTFTVTFKNTGGAIGMGRILTCTCRLGVPMAMRRLQVRPKSAMGLISSVQKRCSPILPLCYSNPRTIVPMELVLHHVLSPTPIPFFREQRFWVPPWRRQGTINSLCLSCPSGVLIKTNLRSLSE